MTNSFRNYLARGVIYLSGILSVLMCYKSSRAQIITNTFPQYQIYTMPAGYVGPSTTNDVITNCDMLEDPAGAIKSVAWSSMNIGPGYPGSNMCQFMVEDYAGNR
ncbi:MAG: hypothetical protein JST36_08530, partial [Bacteroidetes bacterium]|nr:hypothetical protein [Bacteroidota bacterium]